MTSSDPQVLLDLARQLGEALGRAGRMMVTVESCTAGGIAAAATEIAGSSAWFDRGWVTYSNAAKTEMVGVDAVLIHQHGAVSEPVARAMVRGALARSGDDHLAVAVTGVAGPDGGSDAKPVGTVYIAWSLAGEERVECHRFDGDRHQVRQQTVARALAGALECLAGTG